MVAERTAVRFEREQDSRKYMTGDAGERYSRIPGWARQLDEGTKIQERYHSGPRLEAQLTGRAESAVEKCGWLSHEYGMETFAALSQDTLRQACITRHGILPAGVLLQVKKEKYEPMTSWNARYRNEYTKIRRAFARLQRAESTDDTQAPHSYFSPQGGQPWNWSERSTEEVMERDDRSDANSNTWSNWNWDRGRQTGTAHGM